MDVMERDFKGIWIPKEIWLSTKLSMQEKILLCEINSLDNEYGCYASNGYFAEFFQLSKTRISQMISELQNKGLISVDYIYREGSKEIQWRILHVVTDLTKLSSEEGIKGGIENIKGGIENIKGTPLRKSKDNNTILNNTNKDKKDNQTANAVLSPTKKGNSNLFSDNTKLDKQKKKATEIKTMESMVNAFSQSDKVRKVLLTYFRMRVKKGLIPDQWQIILADITKVCGNDEELIIEKVNGAIAGNYMQIIASWEKPVASKRAKKSFDNLAGKKQEAWATMTPEEQQQFDDNLSRDAKGNLVTF